MAKIKLSKKERTIAISILKEKKGALEAKLQYFQFLDRYDKEDFPLSLEEELQDEIEEIEHIIEKLKVHLLDEE